MESSSNVPGSGWSMFPWLVGGSQVVGVACVVMTGVWMAVYRGGLAWDGTPQTTNIHATCMVLGMVFLYGEAVLVYRVFPKAAKKDLKIAHAVINMLAFIVSLIGVVALFDYNRAADLPDMYSLHSWCGIVNIFLFFIQWLLGLTFFLFPVASSRLRTLYLPLHVFFGLALFALSVASCLTGITEKLFLNIKGAYQEYVPEGMLGNSLALLLCLFGGLVGYLTTREEYKRQPIPDKDTVSFAFKTLTEGESTTLERTSTSP